MLDRLVQYRAYEFIYTNYAGKISNRRIRYLSTEYGTIDPYYKEPTMMLRGFDIDKNAERSFNIRMIDMNTFKQMDA